MNKKKQKNPINAINYPILYLFIFLHFKGKTNNVYKNTLINGTKHAYNPK